MNKSISCGYVHLVALRSDGNIECWGSTNHNQCDLVYKTFTNIISIVCGNYFSVALKRDGTLECWETINQINVIKFINLLLM